MTTGGWIFMIGSWTLILGVLGYCMYRIVTEKRPPVEADQSQDPTDGESA